ncbi:MAG: RNA polymerase sigma factor [Bacteroidales bacterium]|nr:RNA polymerase sigma factor [Bacteroidales bacterium]
MPIIDADRDLVARCLKREMASQQLLYRRFAPKMFGICLRYAGNTTDAEDILQEGFLRVFNKLHHYRGEGSLEGWICRTMINTTINFYRKQMKFHQEVDLKEATLNATISEDALSILTKEELLKVIHELPVGFRTVFNLFVMEGYSHHEIGAMLGIPENTSKSQLHRAKVLIRRRLTEIGIRDK